MAKGKQAIATRITIEERELKKNKKKAPITYNVQVVFWPQNHLLIVLEDGKKEKENPHPPQKSLSVCELKAHLGQSN